MFHLLAVLVLLAPSATNCVADVVTLGDEEYEEIIIRRKKAKPTTAVVQAAVTPPLASATTSEPVIQPLAPPSPPPPPEPPTAEAAEPRRLVRYFCKAWKDEDWERLWWSMTPKYRKRVSLKKFTGLFVDDAEANGGLKDENILGEFETNAGVGVKVQLIFKFKRAKSRVVKAEVERLSGGQYRIVQSAIIPVDFNDL